jgi:mannose-6-phosphate isomerase-like protein (cupin superfamily)
VADTSPPDREPVNGGPDALAVLRRHLEHAEADLRAEGYEVERCVTPPGALLSDQSFDSEIRILVVYGAMEVSDEDRDVELTAGSHLLVPSGVPFALRTTGETNVYWLRASRKDPTPKPNGAESPKAGGN